MRAIFILLCSVLACFGQWNNGSQWTNVLNQWRATNAGKMDFAIFGHSIPEGYEDGGSNATPTNILGPNNLTNWGGYLSQYRNNNALGTNQESGNTNADQAKIIYFQLGGYARVTNFCRDGFSMDSMFLGPVQQFVTNSAFHAAILQGGIANDITSGSNINTGETNYLNQIAGWCWSNHVKLYVSEETPYNSELVAISNWNTWLSTSWAVTNPWNATVFTGIFSLLASPLDGTILPQYTTGSAHLNTNGMSTTAGFWLTNSSNFDVTQAGPVKAAIHP